MKTKLYGSCLCGAVTYEALGNPADSSYCHCDDCRKATGGPYTVGVKVLRSDLTLLSGTVKGYTTVADSGRNITREFCPACGSPLFTKADALPEEVFIKAGSLDNAEVVKPSYQGWTKCALPWAVIDESLPRYPEGND